MDQRRHFFSMIVAIGCFFVWMQLAPRLFPQFFPQPKQAARPNAVAKKDNDQDAAAKGQAAQESDKPAADAPQEEPAKEVELPDFPHKNVLLGKPGFEEGYLLQARVDTQGAAVSAVWLTDPRYKTIDRKEQLKVVGNPLNAKNFQKGVPETFDIAVPSVNQSLEKYDKSLATVNWEIVSQDAASITLRYPSPDGTLEFLKTFKLPKVPRTSVDSSPQGYLMDVELTIRNVSEAPVQVQYALMGPVGVPLENPDNTRVFREIKLGTLENPARPNNVTAATLRASDLVEQVKEAAQPGGDPVEEWHAPLHYAGVDSQFFSALILPRGDQSVDKNQDGEPDRIIAETQPLLLDRDAKNPDRSDLTVVLESPELSIPANEKVTNTFQAFFGPKRPELLNALNAESTIQLGWFASVAKIMLIVLGFFHRSIGLPYALAIILLTVVVRGLMFPISRKQAIEAEKMKILAPKMKELQERHKNQPEEFAKAYREFQRKHNYHPMMGCLPALIQLPIFLGLYNSLYHAVDLRLARFLWIDNLAAPDAVMDLGFTVPWFGWTELNVLPIVTVILFVAQQKLFTPPPTSEEQAMQYKMMNVMMIAIGFAFYRVPAGLCLYFISSSLWGLCERMLLKKSLTTHQEALNEAQTEESQAAAKTTSEKNEAPQAKSPGWWDRIIEAADQAKNATEGQKSRRQFSREKGAKRSKPRR